jgi:NCAIR mutase (PurE)-related protein
MDETEIRDLLERHRAGDLDTDALVAELAHAPYANLGFARVDHEREVRTGFPEVVFGEGKTPEQVGRIAAELLAHGDRLLVTRASVQVHSAVSAVAGDAVFEPVSRTITVDRRTGAKKRGQVTVVSGGTADLPVAMEAVITAEMMDRKVERHFDIGVAGLHRLLDSLEELRQADAIVAVAGMDGALPAVLAGLVSVPVIAVPTSVGYGASFEGVGPLLTMLSACAPGVAVVNIDNGFGAGYMAAQIAKNPSPD